MTTPEATLQEIRMMLDRARPDQLRKLYEDILRSGDQGRRAV